MSATSFTKHPPIDFTQAANRAAMQEALAIVRQRLGRHCPLVIGSRTVDTPERLESHDPSQKSRVVGSYSVAAREHVEQAVAAAKEALPGWWNLGVEKRAEFLQRAADAMRERLRRRVDAGVAQDGQALGLKLVGPLDRPQIRLLQPPASTP